MSPPPSTGPPLPFWKTFAASAFAAVTAEICTLPLDTAKVRLQIQKAGPDGALKYKGLISTVGAIAREEGLSSLWKGMTPGIHRQCLFGGLRISLYDPVKNLYVGKDHQGPIPLHLKVAAALTTGAFAICVASPTDLVKVRMQSEGRLPPGAARQYPSALAAYSIIARKEGIAGLWTGLGPNVMRNAIINAAELATYDQIKEGLLYTGLFKDDVICHLASGLGAGFFAVCIGSPVDVVKSRMMANSARYKGTIDCFAQTMMQEGPLAFYKGFGANFGRLGSWNCVMFLTLEQAKKFAASTEH